MFKNLLVPFVFTLAVAHTAHADSCAGSGPIKLSSSCSEYNCFDDAHILGADISCTAGGSEAECASTCCSQANCKGFDYSASDQGLGAGWCCTSYVSRVEGGLQYNGGTRSCEKNSITCGSATPVSTHPTDSNTECWIDLVTESQKGNDCFEEKCPPLHTKGGNWCKLHSHVTAQKYCCGDDCCKPNGGAIAGVVIGVVIGVTLLIVSSCYYGRCGCFRYRRDQLIIAAAAAARPQQPQVVYVQPAPAKDITSV